jgi:glycosyltransferase involved in cell wall biosynthesis
MNNTKNNDRLHVFEVVKSTAGVGQYARWLAQGLDRSRFRLTYACVSEGSEELAAYLNQIEGVRAFNLPMERYRVDPIGDARLTWQLAKFMRRESFDLIHAHASKPGLIARIAATGSTIPVIYRPACFAFHDAVPTQKAKLIAAIERIAARHLTASIQCVCNDERELALRYRVGTDQQLVTIHTGIDAKPFDVPIDKQALRAQFGIPVNSLVIGSVGRLCEQKAPLDFVRAAAEVAMHAPHVHFVWVGSGDLEASTRNLVAQLHLTDVFHFLGERHDIPQLLQTFDVFVLSSRWEGFSLSVLEAMASRLPVIATRVMGTAEAVIDGENGYLVPPGSPQALAEAMRCFTIDQVRAIQFGIASRKRVDSFFTRERMMAQIAQLYEATVHKN